MITGGKTIKSRLFIYFFILFAIFTGSILIFQEHREKQFKIAQLESRLREYANVVDRYIDHEAIKNSNDYGLLDSLKVIIHPEEIRITVINLDGGVLYDNSVSAYHQMGNHLQRPEVQKAKYAHEGYHIRISSTTKQKYFYFARSYDDLLIRTAMVYDIEVRNFLKTEQAFIIYLVALFLVFGFILNVIAGRLGDSVSKLKDFALKIGRNEDIDPEIHYRNDELGIISQEIARIWEQTRKTKEELALEKEKLISHLYVLKEGVAFFSAQKKVILNNSHFVFYTNIISEESSVSVEKIFNIKAFNEMAIFIDKILSSGNQLSSNDLPRQEYVIQRDSYHFKVQCIFFQDKSFEVLITDNTQMIKRSLMKQQLTSNIAHELKTPISSAKGYLETIRNNQDIEPVKIRYFVDKAFKQTERLSQLVSDIALLNKIEESSELYAKEKVEVRGLIHEVTESLSDDLKKNPVVIENLVEEKIIVNVNYSLLFSVFRNLLENSINYGGGELKVTIANYHEDAGFHYFSFADNGMGVDDEHLPRLFERFYRVDSGRSRKHGGTGLGLAIVKNAVLSFKGEITVRKRQGGGLEFLFSLPK